MKPLLAIVVIVLFRLGMFAANAQALSIHSAGNSLQITWPGTVTGLILEATSELGPLAFWQPVVEPPLLANSQFSVTLNASDGARFFRLHTSPLTSIAGSSPANGETGVAVTRETIVYFSQPLAETTALGTNNFYATFGGRRILSRAELATDRRKATLFYLEPLPGGARVNVFFDAEGLKDSMGQPLDPAGTGQANGFKLIQFDTLSLTPLAGTAIIGRVFASELVPGSDTGTNAVNKPLAGVTITVDGMEQTLRTVTDVQGNFTLSPVPPGRFFVHIDGRTVMDPVAGIHYPDQSYYPFVGKAWDAVAGKTNNLAGGTGEIYLPLITPGTLQPVSLTQGTSISFPASVVAANPALAGVTITVPANSLFSDDGTRGGKVGIAPVPPDRLPGPLPPGLEAPIVITVQTDGPLNFDKPAPICFPNLPDPVLKTPLPAGSRQALVSFNHKKGIWEAVGGMTVSADGKFVCTDPGFGILQPGWHAVAPVPDEPPPPPEAESCEAEDEASLQSVVALHGHFHKKGDNCKCKPHEKSLNLCTHNCAELLKACVDKAAARLLEAQEKCQECGPFKSAYPCDSAAFKKGRDICLDREFRKGVRERRDCFNEDVECGDACLDCWGTPAGSHANLGLLAAGDPLEEKLLAISASMEDLIRPFASEDIPISDEVLRQLEQLRIQADALAGGNAAGYLRNIVASVAEQFGHEPEEFDAGNAPAYPVPYAATIFRQGDALILRGETGPSGQYSLFVPRDGVLAEISFYDLRTRQYASIAPNENRAAAYRLPRFTLLPLSADEPDSDKDALPNVVEDVYGTDATKADTDGDGISDGAEVEQGTNPLDGQRIQTGIIATAKTPGAAIDIWAGDNFIVTAEGAAGVSVFTPYNGGANPTLVAHLSISGNAQRVAGAGNFIAVAAGEAGLMIIEATSPGAARISDQRRLGIAEAVTADAGTAYFGFRSGLIAAIDLATGLALNQLSVTNVVRDLALAGDHLYAITDDRLFALSIANGVFELAGSTSSPAPRQNRRLFVGTSIAYTVHPSGYNSFDLTNPAQPVWLTNGPPVQLGWEHLVDNGSGLGLAAVGPTTVSLNDVSLYDLSDPSKNEIFLATLTTPGIAHAVSIFNGLAYVADDLAGLQVINYLAADSKGVPPAIALTASPGLNGVVQSAPVRVTAKATDDVQVRNVEFYVDGVMVFSDGSFPFEYRFLAPALSASKTNFVVRARANDTGGNSTWSEELTLSILPDSVAPVVIKTTPQGGGKGVNTVRAYFSELMDPATLTAATFQLFSAGADGLVGTADDVLVNGSVVSYRPDIKAASMDFASPLADGVYRALLTTGAADLAGNRLTVESNWQFRVADAVFWNNAAGGFWDEPGNWSTGTVPGPGDNVIIHISPAEFTVTLQTVTQPIKSLFLDDRLEIFGGTLRGATITQNGGAKLVLSGHPNNTLDGVSITGDLTLTNRNSHVQIRNGLTLTGTVLIDDAAVITFAGDQTLNTGSVSFIGAGFWDIEGNSTLTLGPSMVVRGKSGNIRGGKLINQGLISADVPGGFTFMRPDQLENSGIIETKNGASLTIDSPNWNNAGRIEASDGAVLTLSGAWNSTGAINVTDATVNVGSVGLTLANLSSLHRTGGTVNLNGVLDLKGETLKLDAVTGPWTLDGGTIKNGTLAQSGAKLLLNGQPANTLDSMNVQGDLELAPNSRLQVRNGLSLTGTVLVDGAVLAFLGDQTFNTGSVLFAGTSGFLDIDANTTLMLGPTMAVRGKTGNIRLGSAFSRLINQGLISSDVAGGAIFISGGQFENAGTVESKNGGSLSILAVTWSNTGRIDAAGGGALTLEGTWNNSGTISANEVTVNLGGTFTLSNLGTFNRTGGAVNVTGVLDLTGATLTLNEANGSWTLRSGTIKGGTVLENDGAKLSFLSTSSTPSTLDGVSVQGDLDLSQGGQVLIRNGLKLNGTVLLDKGGTISFAGDQIFDAASVVFAGNSGSVGIEGNSTLTLGPALVVRGKIGTIGGGTGKLINQGSITADVAGGALFIRPTQFENTGTIAATATGSTITITANPFTNTGVIQEVNGGKVLINP